MPSCSRQSFYGLEILLLTSPFAWLVPVPSRRTRQPSCPGTVPRRFDCPSLLETPSVVVS
jgi:hypothetical protein